MANGDETVVSWEQAGAAEFELLHQRPPGDYARDAFAVRQSALCLSGGGIRSAAFCLGVLQAFARENRLTHFHYLSTVSGGGYIGSWLQVLMHEEGTQTATHVLTQENPPQVEWLRQFTSYLTPTGGILSKDTWAGIMLYLRNLLLNWMVFLPFFMLLTIVAICERTTFAQLYQPASSQADRLPEGFADVFGVLGAIGLVAAVVAAALMLPSHRGEGHYVTEQTITRYAVVPSLAWAFLAPLAAAPWFEAMISGSPGQQLALPFIFWCLVVAGFVLASLESVRVRWNGLVVLAGLACAEIGMLAVRGGWDPAHAAVLGAASFGLVSLAFAIVDRHTETELGAYFYNLFPWLCAAAIAAGLVWGGERLARIVPVERRAEVIAVLAPFWLVLSHGLLSAMFVGLRREVRHAELDREWLARLSALKLRIAAFWAAFAAA